MLHIIQNTNDLLIEKIKEDPIRPHIPVNTRIGSNKNIFVLLDNLAVNAITCVSYNSLVPKTEQELFTEDTASIAIFYTIWSYVPGSGRQLILDSVNYIKTNNPNIKRYVTLSPKTDMAKRFHLKNGAFILRENLNTVNYEYLSLIT